MTTPDQPHVIESLPGYVLGALDKEETEAVRLHLAGCLICRRELAVMQKVSDDLALAAPQAVPSRELKLNLMKRLPAASKPRPATRWAPAFVWPAAALAAVMLFFAGSSVYLWTKLNNQQVLTGPQGMRAVALQSTGAAPDASGFVIIGADGKNGALVVDRLPVLDEGHTYQVWLTNAQGTVSGAVFSVDEYGYRGARLNSPENLLSYDEIEITIEPADGSPQPTTSPVLQGLLHRP